MIYAYGETNIAITGKGTIDGQGSNETWWPMCGAPRYGWKEGMVAQRNGGRERLLMYGETSTPIYKRVMTPEDGLRPQLINLYSCSGLFTRYSAKVSLYAVYTFIIAVPMAMAATPNLAKMY